MQYGHVNSFIPLNFRPTICNNSPALISIDQHNEYITIRNISIVQDLLLDYIHNQKIFELLRLLTTFRILDDFEV